MPDDCLKPMANDAGWPHMASDLRAENAKLCAEIERLTAENERLRGRNAALVESLRAHRCLVDNRATVGECQQCGCIDGLLISGDTQQTTVRSDPQD